MKKNPSKKEVVAAIDKAFAPDIKVKLNGVNIVTACSAVTPAGGSFLGVKRVYGMPFDTVLKEAGEFGLTIETVE